jgi:hypothetical protein
MFTKWENPPDVPTELGKLLLEISNEIYREAQEIYGFPKSTLKCKGTQALLSAVPQVSPRMYVEFESIAGKCRAKKRDHIEEICCGRSKFEIREVWEGPSLIDLGRSLPMC